MTCASYCHASAALPAGNVRPAVILIRACSCCNARQVRAQLSHLILSQPIQPTHSQGFCNQRVTNHSVACSQRSSLAPGQRVIEGRSGDTCDVCGGTTQVPCSACKGSGKLTKAGYHSRNPVDTRRIVGSKWTALQRTLGWRHFRATEKTKRGKHVYALMMATCDPAACLWINAKNLKDRGRWASGWLQRSEIEAMTDLGATCQVCAGTGHMICPICKNEAVVIM